MRPERERDARGVGAGLVVVLAAWLGIGPSYPQDPAIPEALRGKVEKVDPAPASGRRDVKLTVTIAKMPESALPGGVASLWWKKVQLGSGEYTVDPQSRQGKFTLLATRHWFALPYGELEVSIDSGQSRLFNLGAVDGQLSPAKAGKLTVLPEGTEGAVALQHLVAKFEPEGQLPESTQVCTEEGLGLLNEVEPGYRSLDPAAVKADYRPKGSSDNPGPAAAQATLTFEAPNLPAAGEAKDWKLQVDLCTPAPQTAGDPPLSRWTFQGLLPEGLPREPTSPKVVSLRISPSNNDHLVLVADPVSELPAAGVGFLRSVVPVDQRQFLGSTVSYQQGKESLRLALEEVCDPDGAEAPGTVRNLEITALDKQGREVRFTLDTGQIELCPKVSRVAVWLRRSWFDKLVLPLGGLGLLALILFLYRSTKGSVEQENASLRTGLRDLFSKVDGIVRSLGVQPGASDLKTPEQILALQQSLESRIANLERLRNPQGGDGPLGGDPEPSFYGDGSPSGAFQESGESGLVSLVNGSWMGDGDARGLAARQGLETFRSVDSSAAMRSITNRTFRFEPARGGGSWIGVGQGSELLLAPVHRRLFGTGDSLMFLSLLFDGLGSDLETVDFRRLVRPCRLRKAPEGGDRYTLIQKGRLETIASGSAPPSPASSRSANRAEPKELPASYERQVRKWVEEAVRSSRAHTAPPPPLAIMDPEVPRLEGRLEAVEGTVAQLVRNVKALTVPPPEPLPTPRALPSAAPADFAPIPTLPEIGEALVDWSPSENDGAPPAFADSLLAGRGTSRPVTQSEAEILLGSLAPDWSMAKDTLFPAALGGLSRTPGEYLRALVALKRAAEGLWTSPEWVVGLTHLSPQGSMTSRGPRVGMSAVRDVAPDYESVLSDGRTIRDTLIYQLALGVSRSDRRAALVFPAAGLPIVRFEPMYRALLGAEVPAGSPWVQGVRRPAILVPHGEDGFFTIAQTIQLEYGS